MKHNKKTSAIRKLYLDKKLNYLSNNFFTAATLSPSEKRKIFSKIVSAVLKHKKELLKLIIDEIKLTQKDAEREIDRCVESFSIAKKYVDCIKENKSVRDSKEIVEKRRARGPLFVITPFSSPLSSPAHKIACGLLAGTSVLFKPSKYAKKTGEALYKIITSATKGKYVDFLIEESENELKYILKDDRIGIISFTGGYETGKKIVQIGGVKKYHMELSGGNSLVIFTPDFKDYSDKIVDKLISSILTKNGQRCNSIKHIFLPHKYSTFISNLQDKLIKVKVNIKKDFRNGKLLLLGPLISEEYAIRTEKKVEKVLSIIQKYSPVIRFERSRDYIYPSLSVIRSIKRDKIRKILDEDIPGPVVFVHYYNDLAEYQQIIEALQNDYIRSGLQLSFFTSKSKSAKEIASGLLWGGIIINDVPTYRDSFMSFGGFGKSGLGKEGFFETINAFTDPQVIVTDLSKN